MSFTSLCLPISHLDRPKKLHHLSVPGLLQGFVHGKHRESGAAGTGQLLVFVSQGKKQSLNRLR